jgi:hypothetical protein
MGQPHPPRLHGERLERGGEHVAAVGRPCVTGGRRPAVELRDQGVERVARVGAAEAAGRLVGRARREEAVERVLEPSGAGDGVIERPVRVGVGVQRRVEHHRAVVPGNSFAYVAPRYVP